MCNVELSVKMKINNSCVHKLTSRQNLERKKKENSSSWVNALNNKN